MWRRWALVKAVGRSDCGAAALATIALHHHRPTGLQWLRELAGTDRSGTSLLALVQAAERLGFAAKGVRGRYESLLQVPLPAIAHVQTEEGAGHYVVLHHVTSSRVVVADPARCIERLSRDEFSRRWTGVLLLIVPAPGLDRSTANAPPASARRQLLALMAPHAAVLSEAFTCALLMTTLGVATSYFIQHLVDSVLVRREARLLNALGVGMVMIALFRALFGMLRQYLLAHVGRKVDLALIAAYTRHVLGLPLGFFEMRQVGEILARVYDAAKVREVIGGATTTALVDGTLVGLSLSVLWLYDPPLALVATACVPALAVSAAVHHPAARRRSLAAMEHSGRLAAHLVEDVSGIETVKAFGAERTRCEEGEARLVGFVQSLFGLEMLGLSMSATGALVTALAGIVILWYGGHRVMTGALTIGQLMFFSSLLSSLLGPLERVATVSLKVQDALAATDRLSQILDLEPESRGTSSRMTFRGIREAIELRGVGFRYGSRAAVLEGLNLRIPAGRVVAVVGESGSGKSTLLKLLMGFYTPTEGRITIDGVDLRDFDPASLRARIGLVAQDPFVFTGTVRENIALGRPGATPDEVIEAARAAGLDEFITALPQRYETLIGERGANLSGGQRQRLAIARALLRRPDLLLFDEATSHLDTATERAIQEGLRTSLSGRTVVLVAHRLSTIKEADSIYVLHQGRAVEEGTHRQLVARQGRYWSLWRSQAHDGTVPPCAPAAAGRNGKVHTENMSHA
jgi:ATP-binding cassette subfamily B protein